MTKPGQAVSRRAPAAVIAAMGSTPWALPVVMLLVTLTGVVAACGGAPPLVGAYGRNLEVYTTRPEFTEKLAFKDAEGNHRVVRPKASNRQLAIVNITVVNKTTTVIPLLVDAEAVQIGDRRGERLGALDPFLSSKVVNDADSEEDKYLPFMLGEHELDRGFQMSGWLAFDVPKGLRLSSLWWNEVDDMVVDYIPYQSQTP